MLPNSAMEILVLWATSARVACVTISAARRPTYVLNAWTIRTVLLQPQDLIASGSLILSPLIVVAIAIWTVLVAHVTISTIGGSVRFECESG